MGHGATSRRCRQAIGPDTPKQTAIVSLYGTKPGIYPQQPIMDCLPGVEIVVEAPSVHRVFDMSLQMKGLKWTAPWLGTYLSGPVQPLLQACAGVVCRCESTLLSECICKQGPILATSRIQRMLCVLCRALTTS